MNFYPDVSVFLALGLSSTNYKLLGVSALPGERFLQKIVLKDQVWFFEVLITIESFWEKIIQKLDLLLDIAPF